MNDINRSVTDVFTKGRHVKNNPPNRKTPETSKVSQRVMWPTWKMSQHHHLQNLLAHFATTNPIFKKCLRRSCYHLKKWARTNNHTSLPGTKDACLWRPWEQGRWLHVCCFFICQKINKECIGASCSVNLTL